MISLKHHVALTCMAQFRFYSSTGTGKPLYISKHLLWSHTPGPIGDKDAEVEAMNLSHKLDFSRFCGSTYNRSSASFKA